jgi:hypothetical protein
MGESKKGMRKLIRKPCTCAKEVDALLTKRNTQLVVSLSGKAVLRTESIDEKGARGATMIATYCPFCGQKYQDP